jgi:hypothetical protein
MQKKHIGLVSKYVPVNGRLVLGHAGVVGSGMAPVRRNIVNELTESVGGLLISQKGNIFKGGKVKMMDRKRPIKFVI